MQNKARIIAGLISRVVELQAKYSTKDLSEFLDRASELLNRDYLIVPKNSMPKINSTDPDPHYHVVGSLRIARNSDPQVLRRDALAMLAVADERDRELDAENEELAPYRIDAIEELYTGYYGTVDKYTYLGLDTTQKKAIDTIVELRVANDEMKFRLDSLDK